MIHLSVNVNKIATLRNARGGNTPDVLQVALDCERFGADGITVHPRPDQRHIRFSDVLTLAEHVTTEFNIEGYPSPDFIELVCRVKPAQVTLVPDPPDVITSNAGWDTDKFGDLLKEVTAVFHTHNIRVSIFMNPDTRLMPSAAATGTDRIELYTEAFAQEYPKNREKAIHPYVLAAQAAHENGLEINAGHDLSLENLQYFAQKIPHLKEVSIGHALISDALYYGLENTVQLYKRCLAL